jgi:hypothetical protein
MKSWLLGVGVAVGMSSLGCAKEVALLAEANIDQAKIDVKRVADALTLHYVRKREMPESLDTLVTDRKLLASQLVDPWQHPLSYTTEGPTAKVCSLGPDGVAGNADDVCATAPH